MRTARIDEQPHASPSLVPGDEVLHVAVVFHEPDADVDLVLFVVDQAEQLGAAVLERRITQSFERGHGDA